jgi:hypothetical protein
MHLRIHFSDKVFTEYIPLLHYVTLYVPSNMSEYSIKQSCALHG